MKKAFTLAETLIVLIILGVIAGFLIPAIIKSKPNKNAIMYKKAFYTIEEAVSKLANDAAAFPGNNIFNQDSNANSNFTDDAAANGTAFCNALANLLNIVGTSACTNGTVVDPRSGALTTTNRNFQTTNGMEFFGLQQGFSSQAEDNTTAGSFITACVDVNGLANGANKGCSESATPADNACFAKKDQFRINIRWDGKIFTNASAATCTAGTDWNVENDILLSPTKTTEQ